MVVLQRLETTNDPDLTANLCSVLTCITRRMASSMKPLADRVMACLVAIMQRAQKTSTVMEDAFLAVGALCMATEGLFY